MKVKVLEGFKDKHTGALYESGDVIEVTQERLEEIEKTAHLVEKVSGGRNAAAKKRTAKTEGAADE